MSNPYNTGKDAKASVLGPTLTFKGELTAKEDLLIQGKIEGTINHSSNLTIGEEGQVKADVKAEFIEVEGKVRGDLKGSKSVVVKDSANVEGNIYSPTVTLLEGSTFNGRIDMTGKEPAMSKSPEVAEEKPSEQAPTSARASETSSRSSEKKSTPDKKRSASAA